MGCSFYCYRYFMSMEAQEQIVSERLKWVLLYEQSGNAGYVCREFKISRPTLRKWLLRYNEQGEAGLRSRSRRPKTSPNQKIGDKEITMIMDIRRSRGLGARKIQVELKSLHSITLSTSSIYKVLSLHSKT